MEQKRPLIVVFVLVVICSVYFSWNYYIEQVNKGKISASGTIEAVEVQVGQKSRDAWKNFSSYEGSNVKKGDVLARIDVDELKARLSSALAARNAAANNDSNARSDYARISSLYDQGMASQSQYDDARTRSKFRP